MIGLMGGTFSPIHYGHLLMCESIREEYGLEKIIFMLAKEPPHKDSSQIIEASDRLEMVKLALVDHPFFEVSDLELHRPGKSYTIDTLNILKDTLGCHQRLALIIGADSLIQIHTWKSYQDIFKIATVIVASRPDTDEAKLDKTIRHYQTGLDACILKASAKALDYASTEIRERVRKGLSIYHMVPPMVEAYIIEKGLYR